MPAGPRDLATKVAAIAHRYPDRRSLTLPALRFAQEEHGWLPPEALREVADVLDLTPGYCQAVASFYDMFHLEPVGAHIVEVCTNIACALCGAGEVLDALRRTLEVDVGGTTADGAITLRTVECLGACIAAPIVAVDERYRERVAPGDIPALVDEVRRLPASRHG